MSIVAAGALAGLAPHAKVSGFVSIAVFLASLGLALVGCLVLWVFVLGHYKHWRTHVDFTSTGHSPIENTLAGAGLTWRRYPGGSSPGLCVLSLEISVGWS